MAAHQNELEIESSRSSTDSRELLPSSSPAENDRSPAGIGSSVTVRLYTSHFLSTWNTRGFEFGAVLFLATIYPGTLLPMSVYALVRALSAIIFSPSVGAFIDSRNRLEVVRVSIVAQRAAVALSCLIFWFMLRYRESLPAFINIILLVSLIGLACVEKLCSIMNMISVERDWVVVIGQGEEATLRVMNSQMRRIDLFCKILSPLAIALIDGWSSQLAILITLFVNTVSISVEYALIATVYRRIPALATPKHASSRANQSASTASATITTRFLTYAQTFRSSLHTYATHRTFLPSFSLNLLYFTVISFAGQMTTYLLAIGLTSTTIGLLRTVSTAFELSATFIAPYLMSRIGPVRAGIWSQSWLMVCVTFVVAILWSSGTTSKPTTLATALMVSGVIVSRIGTWCFDLCAQLIIQDEISAESRGSFSSMEASVRNVFELCRFAATIVFARPEQFRYPALMTLIAVWLSGSVYTKFVRDRRGHLLHMPSCLKGQGEHQVLGQTGRRAGRAERGRYEVLEMDEGAPQAR